ncbi:MAG TPA: molybdate ABC transporter substrate-binding protein [Micropepsaceae bacterium]|nr:molybdate ABC transporter substrate-binding protein [Micropepsaceae bacterium]
MNKSVVIAPAIAAMVFLPAAAQGAQLNVYVSGAMAHAIQQIAEDFANKHGDTLNFVVGTTGTITDRIHKGEKPDLVEMTSAGLAALEKEHLVVAGSGVELSRAVLGIAVKSDAPAPDISNRDALKRALNSARHIAYIDPKTGGQAGAGIVHVLERLGIAGDAAKKSVYGPTGAAAVEKVAAGDADVAVAFASEVLPIKGVKLVGLIEPALQDPAVFAGGVGANAANPADARALLQAIISPEGAKIVRAAGLEPVH